MASKPSQPANRPSPSELLASRPRANRSALAISLICHLGLAAVFVGFISDLGSGTAPPPESRSVGMAVVHRLPDRTRYVTEPDSAAVSTSAADAQQSSASAASMNSPNDANTQSSRSGDPPPSRGPFDLDSVIAALDAGTSPNRNESPAGDGGNVSAEDLVSGRIRTGDGRSLDELGDRELVPGRTRVGLGAGRTSTQVFGVTGSGSTFVYVFDRSESMLAAGGAPLRALKSELIRSLDTLTERQQFQIIFYNDQAEVFKAYGDRVGLVTGEEGTIARAKQFVRGTVAVGGTEHSIALKMAMQMAPDVVFFLTDAKIQTMSNSEMDEISRRAEAAGTTIHGIQFGTGPQPGGSFVERLATKNRGGYRYVDVTDLN